MMGPATRYVFKYADQTLECEPDNWQDFEMGLVRQDFGVNREISAELTFSGMPSIVLQSLFSASGFRAVLTMEFYERNNDWTYTLFNTFAADFSTYSFSQGKVSITFIENSVRKLIDDNRGTDYTFDLPTDTILNYEGISYDKQNKLFIQPPKTSTILSQFSTSWYAHQAKKTIREFSSFYEMPYIYDSAFKFKAAITPTLIIKGGIITVTTQYATSKVGTCIAAIRKTSSGALSVVKKWDSEVSISADKKTLVFTIEDEVTITTQAFAKDDILCLCFGTPDRGVGDCHLYQSVGSYMMLQSIEPSLIVGKEIPIVSHEWLLGRILEKIAPTATLTYNLPSLTSGADFSLALSSSSGLIDADTKLITCSFDKVLKSLRCHYGASFDVTGNVVTVDYGTTFFTNVKAQDVEPIGKVTIETDTTHVYNKVTAGYNSSNNCTNGSKEYNCKNTFTIPNTLTDNKELDLVSPFIGSPYTIEQYLTNKETSATESKQEDTSIFVFAVNHVSGGVTTFYRTILPKVFGYGIVKPTIGLRFYSDRLGTIKLDETEGLYYLDYNSGRVYIWNGSEYVIDESDRNNFPTKAYNTVISPEQILLANMGYIAISLGADKIMEFASTDRKADYYQTINGVKHYEDAISPSLIGSPLFKPEKVSFSTAEKITDLSVINGSLYKYFSIMNKNTGIVHNLYIKNITLQLTRINSQEWEGLTK